METVQRGLSQSIIHHQRGQNRSCSAAIRRVALALPPARKIEPGADN
ncbi:MAG: hypothetical protein KA354_05715 [Phycisphaerae bacterium]|nr:hypothetical protein [Phycisphaerae bacterium]